MLVLPGWCSHQSTCLLLLHYHGPHLLSCSLNMIESRNKEHDSTKSVLLLLVIRFANMAENLTCFLTTRKWLIQRSAVPVELRSADQVLAGAACRLA